MPDRFQRWSRTFLIAGNRLLDSSTPACLSSGLHSNSQILDLHILQISHLAKMAKDLLDMIDFSNLECLNEKPQHPAANGGREQLL